MIAALYVETNGVYYGLPDVDPWDEQRDARLYAGPWPVVAHPPCNRWTRMLAVRPKLWKLRGQDGGMFEAALEAVNAHGGVLEHPAYSLAWDAFALADPMGRDWQASLLHPGWTCQVDQSFYGHAVRKLTWLYYVGPDPPAMRWGDGGMRDQDVRNNGGGGSGRRSRTPLAFRDVLLDMARGVGRETET